MTPRVFVSSTFYDLQDIRESLRQFLDDLGYQSLLSEYRSFPVDPVETTIENCKQQVEREADIFVLVVGLRYGSLDTTTLRSVTNIEYLTARAKRIPVYVFLDERIPPLIKRWKADPRASFPEVDSVELLRFAERVRTEEAVWTFLFKTPDDVVATLRIQFGHLMSQGLDWWKRVRTGPSISQLPTLTGRALRLALEQPEYWEYYLFAQVFEDEVAAVRHLRNEHVDGLALELGEDVLHPAEWCRSRLTEIQRLIHSGTRILNDLSRRAIGPSGSPGNVEDLIYVGRAIGHVYASVLRWSRRVRTAILPEPFGPVPDVMARFTDSIVVESERFAPNLRAQLDAALRPEMQGIPQRLEFDLVFELPPEVEHEFGRALDQAARKSDG